MQMGCKVTTATNVQSAQKVLERERYELVMTDVRMPGERDGIELLRHVKKSFPDTEVILVTGFPTQKCH